MLQFLATCVAVLPSSGLEIAETASAKYVVLEMYAATSAGADIASPGNVDLYDAAGLINYLATEVVVETGKAPERPARENGIDTIVKYQIRVHNNMSSSDVDVQAEFAKYVRFEDGAVNNPEDAEMFERSGDLVGVLAFHPPHGDVRFPMDKTFYWFSLSGPCPNMKNGDKKSSNCTKYQEGLVPAKKSQYVAGGLCNRIFTSNIPDGTPGCSYYVENYTKMNLDEIVGVTKEDCGGRKCANWKDFRLHCSNPNLTFTSLGVKYCKEYDYLGCVTSCQDQSCGEAGNEVGIPFWMGRCNASRNAFRARFLEKAFGGSIIDDFYAQNPRCDQYGPMCNKPAPDAGVSYCHRDDSGICDACYVPGTLRSVVPPSQAPCRIDLFLNHKLKQYQDALPQCDSECDADAECSLATGSSACCVYLGKCKRTWKTEDWGSCNATCGNGSKFREVQCPFQEIFGACDAATRPSNASFCRGDRCPWSKSFGNWSDQCDNRCGEGSQKQALICDCPEAENQSCPLEECAKSEKPKNVPSRPCFPLQKPSAAEFCHLCGEADTCQGCTEGYDVNIRTGRCENAKRNRLVLVTYELHALNLALDTNDWLASAFVPAFKDTVSSQITGSSLDVLNVSVSHVGLPNSYSGSTFIVTDAQNSSVKVVVAVSPSENSDASLANLTQQLTQTDFAQLADSLPKTLMKHGCTSERCQMPKDLVWTMQEPNILCPDGQWTSNQCLLPSSSGFPVWAIITISLIVLIAIAAALVWTCSKRRQENSRLLG